MTEGVNLPPNTGLHSHFSLQKLLTKHHVVDHILVVNASFVVHGPASINELQTALLSEHADSRLDVFCLLEPPHLEELHLNLCVSAVGISKELLYNCVESHLNISILDLSSCTSEVSINGLKPADIIVRVRDQVNEKGGGCRLRLVSLRTILLSLQETSSCMVVGVVNVQIMVDDLCCLSQAQSRQREQKRFHYIILKDSKRFNI